LDPYKFSLKMTVQPVIGHGESTQRKKFKR